MDYEENPNVIEHLQVLESIQLTRRLLPNQMRIVSTASNLMQDIKTGYLTLSSPRSMFFSQVLGDCHWLFDNTSSHLVLERTYPAPYGLVYRAIALLGVEGISSLPKDCLTLAIAFFFGAMFINLIRELLQKYETRYRIFRFVPSSMCVALPFYLGSYFAIDMCVGSLILFVWERTNKRKAYDFGPAMASGLICGDSLWGIPAAIPSLVAITPPICMKFLSATDNNRVDVLLNGN